MCVCNGLHTPNVAQPITHAHDAKLIILGELVGPTGMSFQDLCGAVSVNGNEPFPSSIRYVVFDAIRMDEPAACQPWNYRRSFVRQFIPHAEEQLIHTPEDVEECFKIYTDDRGFEGIVLRTLPCLPIFDATPHPNIIKWTKWHSMEGIVTAVEEGRGKRKGMLGAFYIKLDSGRVVKVGGGKGLTDSELAKYLTKPPLGCPITISYKELSDTGIPLKPQFVAVRLYE